MTSTPDDRLPIIKDESDQRRRTLVMTSGTTSTTAIIISNQQTPVVKVDNAAATTQQRSSNNTEMLNRELCISQRQLWEKNKRQEKYINNNIKLFAEVTRVRRAFHMQQKYIDAREKKKKKSDGKRIIQSKLLAGKRCVS